MLFSELNAHNNKKRKNLGRVGNKKKLCGKTKENTIGFTIHNIPGKKAERTGTKRKFCKKPTDDMDYIYDLACKLIDKTLTFNDIDFATKEFNALKGKTDIDISDELAIGYYTDHKEEGVLYCLWNPMYVLYGDNVYKLGCTGNLKQRLNHYRTSYIEPTEVKYESIKIHNCYIAEKILFHRLVDHRIENNREFFDVDLQKAKDTIDKISQEMEADFESLLRENKWVLYNQKHVIIICEFVKLINNRTNDLIVSNTSLKRNRIREKLYNIPQPMSSQEILNADNITSKTHDKYKSQNIHQLSLDQNAQIKKYRIKKDILGCTDPQNDILKLYLSNKYCINNCISLFTYNRESDKTLNKKIANKIEIFEKVQHILEFEFDSSKEYTAAEFEHILKALDKTVTDKNTILLFGLGRQKENVFHKVTAILRHFGVSMQRNLKKDYIMEDGKRKRTWVLDYYKLDYNKDILEIISLIHYNKRIIVSDPIKNMLQRHNKYHQNAIKK